MTIEERAIKHADNAKQQTYYDDRIKGVAANVAYQSYTIGATEQHKIDIDEACEVYRKELKEIINLFNRIGKQLYNIEELGELISLEGSVKDFRKAMEEEEC